MIVIIGMENFVHEGSFDRIKSRHDDLCFERIWKKKANPTQTQLNDSVASQVKTSTVYSIN